MITREQFIRAVLGSFPEDRLTYQKAVPTFHPENASEAASFIKLANQYKQRLFITGFGNNIDPQGEPFVSMVSIRTDRLNELREVVPDDFYITCGGGYPLKELNLHLAQQNLYLPHSALPYVGSVGGALAAGLTGELYGHDVPFKKFFVKAEIVTPTGEIIRPGSVCFKSVSGYDIVRMFFNSWGLLGLIVSASLRVMPLSGADDYAAMKQKAIERRNFLSGLDAANNDTDAVYSRKVKEKFDPNTVLPIV